MTSIATVRTLQHNAHHYSAASRASAPKAAAVRTAAAPVQTPPKPAPAAPLAARAKTPPPTFTDTVEPFILLPLAVAAGPFAIANGANDTKGSGPVGKFFAGLWLAISIVPMAAISLAVGLPVGAAYWLGKRIKHAIKS